MKTIWKYKIMPHSQFSIEMPEGSRTLDVQMQGVEPVIWVLVDPDAPNRPCQYKVVGTGHPIEPEGWDYIGTFQMYGGGLVWHLFVEAS